MLRKQQGCRLPIPHGPMDITLDQLESLWPPYRGAVLLGASWESQGRVRNTGVAVTAGHVALSLQVQPPHRPAGTTAAGTDASNSRETRSSSTGGPAFERAEAAAAAAATDADDRVCPPAAVSVGQSPTSTWSLTVLLDAVPSSAPIPGTHQLARFLTKVLSRRAWPDAGDATGAAAESQRKSALGEDLPDMLVVEHHDEVICSEFLRFYHGPASPTVAGGSGVTPTGTGSNGLVYACIEASGLLRLWQWGGGGGGDGSQWSWSYLNSCNICACREDPIGCRVRTAAIVPEPDGKGDNARHRLVWEQEDSGEGPGLGLASTPSDGPRPPRRVWSRRITFDVAAGGGAGLWSGHEQGGGPGARFGSADGVDRARLEISLAFSACLLPAGVDALLCSRFGAWMPTGRRVYFNHFATGRLPRIVLPIPLSGHRCRESSAAGAGPVDDDAFADAGSRPGVGEPTPRENGARGADREGRPGAREEAFANETADENKPFPPARRLFAVHDAEGDLMIYDHHPRATVRVLSLPSGGGGGLSLRHQCTLEPPPSLARPPLSFAVRSNLAVLSDGGACSVYDLCTGRLLGTKPVPRCPACARRGRHRTRTAPASSISPDLSCTCGRRQGPLETERQGGGWGAAAVDTSPVLWTSETPGHLVGLLTATHVLRIALPRVEACLAAMLAPCSRTGLSSRPSAPSILRYLREYKRLVGGPASGAPDASLLPKVLQMMQQARHPGDTEADKGFAMMALLGHALAADDRGQPGGAATATRGRSRHDESLPPWLMLAMVSAAQKHGRQQGRGGAAEAGGVQGSPGLGGGDPATAATEAGLRKALERRVSESLRSLSSARALLRDPVGSVRRPATDGGRENWRSSADEEAASKLAAITADVDPATALFEGTLREWLACRQKGKGQAPSDATIAAAGVLSGGTGGTQTMSSGLEQSAAPGLPNSESDDAALALAFRCEAVGDGGTTEIPFLYSLLEDSGWADPSGDEKKSAGDSGGGGPPASSSPSSSTFLCLQLAGDDASPLFEIACRALFRLQPRRLPRFVERLARFRAYADEMRRERLEGHGTEDGPVPPQGSSDGAEKETESQPTVSRREGRRTSSSSADARSERTAGDHAGDGWRQDPSSTMAWEGRRSTSPPPSGSTASRRTSEEGSFDAGARAGRPATRSTSIGTSRDHSPAAGSEATPVLASTDRPLSGEPDGAAQPATAPREDAGRLNQETPRKSAPVAPAYFARALACLPPAAEDDGGDGSGHERRRSRLSLLLGACMFTEACRLLRSRAWEGSGADSGDKLSGWRGDRGAAEAWSAVVRLLNELSRAAAREAEVEAATAAFAAAAAATASTPVDAAEAGAAAAATDVPPPPGIGVHGRVSLQFRLAFEDTLAETILADSPERMKAVMHCRPSGLTPVAVVRMVRRAAKTAAAAAATGAAGDRVAGGGKVEPGPVCVSGSTQTLKMCLLMLLEGGMGQGPGAA